MISYTFRPKASADEQTWALDGTTLAMEGGPTVALADVDNLIFRDHLVDRHYLTFLTLKNGNSTLAHIECGERTGYSGRLKMLKLVVAVLLALKKQTPDLDVSQFESRSIQGQYFFLCGGLMLFGLYTAIFVGVLNWGGEGSVLATIIGTAMTVLGGLGLAILNSIANPWKPFPTIPIEDQLEHVARLCQAAERQQSH